eukprot:scaffold88466_cov67-Phaeocystis_antarctica.AAC.3
MLLLRNDTLLKTHTRAIEHTHATEATHTQLKERAHFFRGSRHATRSPRYATEHNSTVLYRAPGIRHQLLRKSDVRSPCSWSALGATPVLLAAVEFHSPGCGYGWRRRTTCAIFNDDVRFCICKFEVFLQRRRTTCAIFTTTCAFVFASLRSSCSVGAFFSHDVRFCICGQVCAQVEVCSACCSDDVQLCVVAATDDVQTFSLVLPEANPQGVPTLRRRTAEPSTSPSHEPPTHRPTVPRPTRALSMLASMLLRCMLPPRCLTPFSHALVLQSGLR